MEAEVAAQAEGGEEGRDGEGGKSEGDSSEGRGSGNEPVAVERMVAVGAMAMATDVTAVKAREGVEKKAAATAVVKEVAVKLLW